MITTMPASLLQASIAVYSQLVNKPVQINPEFKTAMDRLEWAVCANLIPSSVLVCTTLKRFWFHVIMYCSYSRGSFSRDRVKLSQRICHKSFRGWHYSLSLPACLSVVVTAIWQLALVEAISSLKSRECSFHIACSFFINFTNNKPWPRIDLLVA